MIRAVSYLLSKVGHRRFEFQPVPKLSASVPTEGRFIFRRFFSNKISGKPGFNQPWYPIDAVAVALLCTNPERVSTIVPGALQNNATAVEFPSQNSLH